MAISKVPSTGINGSAFTVSEAAAANTLNIDSTSSIGIGGAPSRGVLDVFGGRVNIRGNSSDTRAFVTLGDATYINATVAAAYGGDLTINAYPLILSQGQIKFPATQSASSDANTLDDYEEGTWTPGFNGTGGTPSVTFSSRSGYYTKIGDMVFVTCRLTVSSASGGSGTLTITGLPFGSGSGNAYPGCSLGYKASFVTQGPDYGRFVGTTIELYKIAATGETAITPSNIGTCDLIMSGCYVTST
jgi:hypothetical protein